MCEQTNQLGFAMRLNGTGISENKRRNSPFGARLQAFFVWVPRHCLSLLFVLLSSASAFASDEAQTIVHLLDYIAVDYGKSVSDGKIKSADEFKEMTEFSAQVGVLLKTLPENPAQARLLAAADKVATQISTKSDLAVVAGSAHALRNDVIAAYKLAIGPRGAPDLNRGAVLYAENCMACHGAAGEGDGPAARGLAPAPANFHDGARMVQRSVYGLFNTITLGVKGTSMASYKQLSDADRWALAFHVANLGTSTDTLKRGEAAWKSGQFKQDLASLSSVAGQSEQELKVKIGDAAVDVQVWLRSQPQLLDIGKGDPIAFTRQKLAESIALYRVGKAADANRVALSAYLEGFELVEAPLRTVDEPLMRRIEAMMIEYRHCIQAGKPLSEIASLVTRIDAALQESEHALSSTGLSPIAVFLASFVILFREGLEAVLVVAALLAFVKRSGQTHAQRYLHGGWIVALLLGAATWFLAAYVVKISGTHRELTEGVTGLIASAMLLYVGFWLHDKSHASAWQGFLMRGAKAIQPGAAWGLALMAFLAVYREVFETVLFYEALLVQAGDAQTGMVVGGLLVAVAALAGITWAMLRYSLRLPLGLFFGASGILLAALAVILAGNGIAALQEAGAVPISPVAFVTISWLGVHPNLQSLGLQCLLVVAIGVALVWSRRQVVVKSQV